MADLQFFDDPAAFLEAVGEHLAADPVLTTVVASVTTRAARAAGTPRPAHPRWWVAARDPHGEVVGVAMRTAPFRPHPLYVLPMPEDAAVALARVLHERGEPVAGVNGAAPAAVVLAEETARLGGGQARVVEHTRLFDLPALVDPAPVPGRLRAATPGDLAVCVAWFGDFHAAAAEQAGRTVDDGAVEHVDDAEVAARIDGGRVWLWEVDGEVVHLTGANAPAYGVARIGPVYTPREHRGRGYASAAVAAVSRSILADGHRACLVTDQANPTSNRVYEALGYRPVVDMVGVAVTTPGPA